MNILQIKSLILTGALAVMLGGSGCSSQPTIGDQMVGKGEDAADLGKKWNEGHEKVSKGEQLVKEGNKLIDEARKDTRKGEDKIEKGNRLIDEGNRLISQSEASYRARFPASYQRIMGHP